MILIFLSWFFFLPFILMHFNSYSFWYNTTRYSFTICQDAVTFFIIIVKSCLDINLKKYQRPSFFTLITMLTYMLWHSSVVSFYKKADQAAIFPSLKYCSACPKSEVSNLFCNGGPRPTSVMKWISVYFIIGLIFNSNVTAGDFFTGTCKRITKIIPATYSFTAVGKKSHGTYHINPQHSPTIPKAVLLYLIH